MKRPRSQTKDGFMKAIFRFAISRTRTPMILAASILCASSALGTVAVLDQSIVPGPNFISAPIQSIHTRAQTFTVGVSGTLVQFDVDIVKSSGDLPPPLPVLWDIRPTVGGVPVQSNTNTLASGSFLSSAVGSQSFSFYSIDLGAGAFQVSQGDVLALVFRTTDPSGSASISWLGDTTNPYNRGAAFDGTPGANSTTWSSIIFAGDDFSVKTYVAPVPEPSLGCLCVLGVGICAALKQREQQPI
jgi:hypothetical protein